MTSHIGDALSALVDGHLGPAEAASARAHVAECSDCAAELEAITASRSWLRDLPAVEPPRGFYDRMLARHRRRIPFGVAAIAAGAAASLMLASLTTPPHHVQPTLTPLVQDHVASASLVDDPIAQMTPVVVPSSAPTTTVVSRR